MEKEFTFKIKYDEDGNLKSFEAPEIDSIDFAIICNSMAVQIGYIESADNKNPLTMLGMIVNALSNGIDGGLTLRMHKDDPQFEERSNPYEYSIVKKLIDQGIE